MPRPKVFAVILNWMDPGATDACLASLGESDYPDCQAIIVDNASTNGSADRFAALHGVHLIRNSANLGFTGGVNTGIRCAMTLAADYVWLVNSDATVAPDALSRLVATAETDPRVGLVSPVLHDPADPSGTGYAVCRFDPVSRTMETTVNEEIGQQWLRDTPRQIVLPGTALLIRRALIETIGEFDDRFFAYVEDVDYSLRSADAGFRNILEPAATVYHPSKSTVEDPSSCAPHVHYYMARNYPLLWRKRFGRLLITKPMVWHLYRSLIMIRRLGRDRASADALMAGLWDGIVGRGGPYDAKRHVPFVVGLVLKALGAAWV